LKSFPGDPVRLFVILKTKDETYLKSYIVQDDSIDESSSLIRPAIADAFNE